MAEERRQFPRRWPHLTTLYNASPFISRPYKEVDDWNTLRPLPSIVGGYPPSYDDTYPRGGFGSYNSNRQLPAEKFGRSFATSPPSNYDAFSQTTYQSLPYKRRAQRRKTTGCLSFCIGVSLIISLIGAVVAIVIVLSSGENCATYRDNVLVLGSPYDHSKLEDKGDVYDNFTRDFCNEIEHTFELFFMEDHICGCAVVSLYTEDTFVNVTFNIEYRVINSTDSDSEIVGPALGGIMYKILNETLTQAFILSDLPVPLPPHVTATPMPVIGNWSTTTQQPPAIVTPSTESANSTGNTTAPPAESADGNTTIANTTESSQNGTAGTTESIDGSNSTRQEPPPAVAPVPSTINMTSSTPVTVSGEATRAQPPSTSSASTAQPILGIETPTPAATTTKTPAVTYPQETAENQSTTDFIMRMGETSTTGGYTDVNREAGNNASALAPDVQSGGVLSTAGNGSAPGGNEAQESYTKLPTTQTNRNPIPAPVPSLTGNSGNPGETEAPNPTPVPTPAPGGA